MCMWVPNYLSMLLSIRYSYIHMLVKHVLCQLSILRCVAGEVDFDSYVLNILKWKSLSSSLSLYSHGVRGILTDYNHCMMTFICLLSTFEP